MMDLSFLEAKMMELWSSLMRDMSLLVLGLCFLSGKMFFKGY
jgi:hypothetical protein